jgi:hypothetical protein
MKARRLDAALHELESAFCLFTVRADPRLVEQIAAHHTGLLSRFLTLIEDLPQGRVRLLSLAKVDRILDRPGRPRERPAPAPEPLLARRPAHPARARAPPERARPAAAVRELVADVQLPRRPPGGSSVTSEPSADLFSLAKTSRVAYIRPR